MALEENILTWNATNWVTVILMVAIGFFVIGVVQKWWQGKRAKKGA